MAAPSLLSGQLAGAPPPLLVLELVGVELVELVPPELLEGGNQASQS